MDGTLHTDLWKSETSREIKKIILASIENLQKLYWFSKLGGWGSKIKPATSILHSWKKGHFLKIEFGDMHNWNLSRLSGFRDMNRKSDLSISPAQRPNQDFLLLLQLRFQNFFRLTTFFADFVKIGKK